ncbi:MAG: type I-A CRISPR-associated protein Cas4/Csa1 [Candidatus Aenigmarchaeota archaeon]|nr:type I-A CRISPR-associated protein Cas4/Csa1 [Candidatus Aenigmarchaeota archaeon]MDI6721964.1 type I-A CRISPR-associated protein Cas4/Csa1 [Candidatus Aenigmarchaeota archaeon]
MYFIFGEPYEQFFGNMLDEASKASISENLRGWSPELRPKINLNLPQYIVAGKYCDSARDVWWKYVMNVQMKKTKPLLQGGLYHRILAEVVPLAKKYVYGSSINNEFDILGHLMETRDAAIDRIFESQKIDVMKLLRVSDINEIKDNMRKLWNYQAVQISASVNMVLSKFINIDADALVAKAIPINVEQRIDGSRIGLSKHLSVDALQVPQPIVIDIKTGKPQKFHELTVTGYAMAYEGEMRKSVDIGCIIYPQFLGSKSVPYIEKKLYIITDEMRQEFIKERDRKAGIILDKKDPGLAAYCPMSCGYFMNCHPSGKDEREGKK